MTLYPKINTLCQIKKNTTIYIFFTSFLPTNKNIIYKTFSSICLVLKLFILIRSIV